ncbi:MAG TPA: WecB/TagA/CpsF family glycosyltransferase [Gemmatimonadales bacterium]|nr:WecB/TagA/CpsF family glycosyltransferase [Gemmatimonadales bacterium]
MEWTNVMGCPVTKLDLDGFVGEAEEFIASRRPHYIAVVNAAKLVSMRDDRELDQSVRSADLIGADGMPIVWASQLLGDALPGRVNGTDLMVRLLERADAKHYRVFFFGASPRVLDQVLARVRRDYPGVRIAGAQHGYFARDEERQVVSQIRDAHADILFIAFGTPKKELWVKHYLADMAVPVVHGVGGSFDVLAGIIPRAPGWMQLAGLEWLFRLAQEPRRMWRRYLITNTAFLALLARVWLRRWVWGWLAGPANESAR